MKKNSNSRFELGDHQIQSGGAKLGHQIDHDQDDEVDTTLSLRPPGTTAPPPPPPPPLKREEPETPPPPPLKQNQRDDLIYISREVAEWASAAVAVKAAVESCGEYSALKVGWHKLEEEDLGTRVVVRCDREHFWKMLRREEQAAVDRGGDGVAVVGVDAGKRVYRNLRMTMRSYQIVIEREWSKVIDHNKPKVGDVVDFWGFRAEGKPHLAFNFREEN